jgi:glycosyltransferase involved in cell wall biosynthesis
MRGGAERQLALLACGLARRGHQVTIITFYGGGPLLAELAEADVSVIDLHKSGRWELFGFAGRLIQAVRAIQPDVLHSYTAVPNVIAILLKPFFGAIKIVWGIRASDLNPLAYSRLARYSFRLERLLSRFPQIIICNSKAGWAHAVKRGFPQSKLIVVPNGIDTGKFKFDLEGRARLRKEWQVSKQTLLIGLVARIDPMKDHQNFLRAACLVTERRGDIRFVCVGHGAESLRDTEPARALGTKLICLPARDDLPAVYSAIDIACSSSAYGEGFSNAIAEAMACGRPCVVTDVGDSAWIVESTGVSLAPEDPIALADALLHTVDQDLNELGKQSRARIGRLFSVDALIDTSEQALINVA